MPDLPPPEELATARRRLFDRRRPEAEGAGPVAIAATPRAKGSLSPQVTELETIRNRLLEDVEAMTARISELEQISEGVDEEQRLRAAEEERQRRDRWAELERLAA